MRPWILNGFASLLFLGSTAVVSAADLPSAPPPIAPAYVPSFSWTGFYVGAHGGYGWGEFDLTFEGTPDQDPSGWFGGGQIGFNAQTAWNIVLGVEADISLGSLDDRVPDGNFIEQGSDIEAFGTARARIGYAFDRWLPYLTGGVAWTNASTDETCPPGAQFGHCSRTGAYERSDSFTGVGWTVGAGVEYAVTDNWSLKGEYLHMDFGKDLHVLGDPASPREADLQADITRFGVNYRFGGQ